MTVTLAEHLTRYDVTRPRRRVLRNLFAEHMAQVAQAKPTRPCSAWDGTFGGGCHNCGFPPPAKWES